MVASETERCAAAWGAENPESIAAATKFLGQGGGAENLNQDQC
jgi:hypothetical protein